LPELFPGGLSRHTQYEAYALPRSAARPRHLHRFPEASLGGRGSSSRVRDGLQVIGSIHLRLVMVKPVSPLEPPGGRRYLPVTVPSHE
jgi:hypothetical protein